MEVSMIPKKQVILISLSLLLLLLLLLLNRLPTDITVGQGLEKHILINFLYNFLQYWHGLFQARQNETKKKSRK
jgi:hypothetical protein